MKQKLIKISEDHYIVIDDSEIKEGDYYIDDANTIRRSVTSDKDYWSSRVDYKKITHSFGVVLENVNNGYIWEVEEALGIEDEALKFADEIFPYIPYPDYEKGRRYGRIEGFRAAQKLMRDKQFTKGDIMNLVFEYEESDTNLSLQEFFLKALAPKTEFNITFDENNKLKII